MVYSNVCQRFFWCWLPHPVHQQDGILSLREPWYWGFVALSYHITIAHTFCDLQDKITALVVANYFLWPLTRYLNDTFVPAEHRVTANHIITVRPRCNIPACTLYDLRSFQPADGSMNDN